MKNNVNTTWKGNMEFDSLVSGHHVIMDASTDGGGADNGPRPKELMLTALAGCTGMDVVSILKKMRVELENFNVNIEANVTEEHPKHYDSMHVIYAFTGKDLPLDKLEKAVKLSQEQYCGVLAVYKKAMTVTFEIIVTESK